MTEGFGAMMLPFGNMVATRISVAVFRRVVVGRASMISLRTVHGK
jgi:hypothetical protein